LSQLWFVVIFQTVVWFSLAAEFEIKYSLSPAFEATVGYVRHRKSSSVE
jgi:hypothetical protein